jgi:hypothetical protein
MRFQHSLFSLAVIIGYTLTAIVLVRSPNPSFAQTVMTAPKSKVQVLKILTDLKLIQRKLEDRITICNGGRIQTRFCPRPPQPTIEPTGAGSIVRALKQTKQAISTLELYLKSVDRE